MTPSLDAAYRAAHYRVFAPVPFTLRAGQGSADLDALLDSHGATAWAFITACNPGLVRLSPAENVGRMAQLQEVLAGFTTYAGESSDSAGEWAEPSLLVVGISLEQAVSVVTAFGQNAIMAGVRGGVVDLVWV